MSGRQGPETRPFGIRDKLGYMFGDFGNDFTFIFASSFLLVFYTKVLGIPSAYVGVLFLVARCIDAFTDITMGRVVDVCRPAKDGRFRPWIRRMCGPVALASFLMYQSGLSGASMGVKIAYMYVTYILWGSIFYTTINIPYGSMASVVSAEPAHRASLSTFRSVGAALASMIIGVGAPLLVYTKDAQGNQVVDGPRFTLIAGVFSLLAIVCYLLCYVMTAERVKQPEMEKAAQPDFGETAAALVTNRALLAIIGAAMMLMLSQLLMQSMNNYLFADYFKNTVALSLINLLNTAVILLVAPFVVPLTKKYGKKETGAVAMLLAGVSFIVLFFLKIRDPFVFCGLVSIASIGIAYFNLIIWANITDVIDYQEIRTGSRDDGTVYAVYSFARKIGQALAGGLGGFALAAIGYDELAAGQTQRVNDGIYAVSTLIPGIGLLTVALILAFAYPLGRSAVQANTAQLQKRHEGGA